MDLLTAAFLFSDSDEEEVWDITMLQQNMRNRRLKNLTNIIQYNPKLYWPATFRFLTRNNTLVNSTFMQKYPKLFLNKLLLTGCSDLNIVKRILKLYAVHLLETVNITGSELSYPICFALLIKVCFGNSDTIDEEKFLPDVAMIELALEARDINFLSALVKYGFCNIPHEVSKYDYPQARKVLVDFWYKYLRDHDIEPQSMNRLRNFNNGDRCCRGLRRMHSTIRIIDLLLFKQQPNKYMGDKDHLQEFQNRQQCLRLYIRATVEPLISKEDIVEFFNWHFRDIPKDFLSDLIREYKSAFPEECASSYTPRTLKHLCRIQFRRYVVGQNGGVLPDMIDSLGLPKSLESYLLCFS